MARAKKTVGSQAGAEGKTVPTHLTREHWFLLRKVALQRSMKEGRRVTLTAVLSEVIDRQRERLEKELLE